jgi:hypothetical protein
MSYSSYILSDTDDSDVENENNNKPIPLWAHASQLQRTASAELEHHPLKVFPRVHPNAVDLAVLFPTNFRTSNGNVKYERQLNSIPAWGTDELTSAELKMYYTYVFEKRRKHQELTRSTAKHPAFSHT